MSQHGTTTPPVKSVDTTLRIIETVRDRNGARPGEIARELDLPTSTVSDHLVTLKGNQYLVKDGDEYRVGLRFLELGDRARSYQKIYRVAQGNIDKLAEDTGELVHLSVEEDGVGTIIYEREGAEAVSLDTYVGRRVEMHCTALGKAMLAHLPEARVDEIVDRYGLNPATDRTITDRAELDAHLGEVREQGYAISAGERIPGLGCIAVPIKGTDEGEVFGALSLCAPLARTEPSTLPDEVLNMVRQTADRIELDLAFDDAGNIG